MLVLVVALVLAVWLTEEGVNLSSDSSALISSSQRSMTSDGCDGGVLVGDLMAARGVSQSLQIKTETSLRNVQLGHEMGMAWTHVRRWVFLETANDEGNVWKKARTGVEIWGITSQIFLQKSGLSNSSVHRFVLEYFDFTSHILYTYSTLRITKSNSLQIACSLRKIQIQNSRI